MLNLFFNNNILRFSLAFLLTALAGCGGGGGGTTGAGGGGGPPGAAGAGAPALAPIVTQTVAGTVAIGAPLVGATVTIKDSSNPAKTATVATLAGGAFSVPVTGMTPPFMLMASHASLGVNNMYSVLPAMSMTTTNTANVNITPITTLVMFELNLGADPGFMYLTSGFTALTSTITVQNAAKSVRQGLSAKLPIAAVTALNAVPTSFDMMYGAFVANGVNAYDLALDNIGKITAYPIAGGATLTTTGTATVVAGIATNYTAATTTAVSAASIALLATPPTVKSDGTTTTTITVSTLNNANAAVPGVLVTMSANFGILGAGSVTTGATGSATVTFTADASRINRTATITATAGAITAQIPVQIVGSTLTLASTGTTLPDNGTAPVTLTVTPKDAGGFNVVGAAVSLAKAGAGNVTFTPASGVTGGAGTFTSVVTGATAGAVTVTASALGATATTALTVSPVAATFAISSQTLNAVLVAGNPSVTAMKIGDLLAITVNAPAPATSVTFATTTGSFTGVGAAPLNGAVVNVPVVAGVATATLTTTQASVATVQVYDPLVPTTSATLTVGMTSATPASVTLQPSPGVVSRSVGTTTGSSTLIALVKDALGFPVGGVPVSFSIVNPTGGGETVSPVVVFSASTTAGGLNLGEARASFTSGSTSTPAGGVQIRATVTPTIHTGLAPSGADATIVIGGTAGSVAFGQATVLGVGGNGTTYVQAMSVLVADSNGNPAPLGTVVNLSVWPIAWSTGTNCVQDSDNAVFIPANPGAVPPTLAVPIKGTFFNEDANENLILDAGEDGYRKFYTSGIIVLGGAINGSLAPANSAGGTLPASVTTDASGVATFNLTYPKSSAIWITSRIRATTVVQGTATVGETAFRLAPLSTDVAPLCLLPPSPYFF